MGQLENGETKDREIDGKKDPKISLFVDKRWAKRLGEILLLNFHYNKQTCLSLVSIAVLNTL